MAKKRIISMSWGYPDFAAFPIKNLVNIYKDFARVDPKDYLQYSPGQGHEGLRQNIVSKKLGDFGKIKKDEILLTPGGTFGIFLAAYFFKNTLGFKTVGVFHPCFDTTLQIFKIVGLKVVELSLNKHSTTKVDCLYFMSRFSNPTGADLAVSQKKDY
jgi:DNA-binding transcriptional MocR family regulator